VNWGLPQDVRRLAASLRLPRGLPALRWPRGVPALRLSALRLPALRWPRGLPALRLPALRLPALALPGGARLGIPLTGWVLLSLLAVCVVALGWLTWDAERLVERSIQLQQHQIAAWQVADLQRRLLRLEVGIAAASARRKVSDEKGLRRDLEQVLASGMVLQQGGTGQGLSEVPEWQPPLRRIVRLLRRVESDFTPFVADPRSRGPAMLTGLREVGRLAEELALEVYTANSRQATHTMAALSRVQRILAGVQALLLVLLTLLAAAAWYSLRQRLRSAYAQLEAQRLVEVELRRAKDAAEEASRIKSDFLASMSHELRTPLTAMLGFCQLVLRDSYGKVPKRIREAVGKVRSQGDHLLLLVNDVLDLSRLEAERMKLEPEPWPPERCVHDAVAKLEVLAGEKGLELVVEPPAPGSPFHYDLRRTTQVLINLIGNAIKFTGQGSVRVRVQTAADEVCYEVADTGMGIPPERIGTLFTEFQQRDSRIARDAPGAGLGLVISKRIVELHGGRIWAESTMGVGSTFRFCLPTNEHHGQATESQDPQR
jgi:signal transduction histidine kinase